ncbi:hypothetical protein BDP55DRAFT_733194 [Colletotrichum godetiae]|uniref:Uncharacterized protein n=1 Tax=Colletotrichum godetiae TaxID=1209918 RepID=A0AAJ0ABN9_9PEZI|nr:uncharacterized protein BDP55DRAFT_733194 [Colletotrichum godetiae]KAK1659558.1 hypothetical protein BDP55DRAFT_733194 [Colletotrichum godetiae]
MALWPFRRRSGRKRSRSGANLSDVEAPPTPSQARRLTAGEATALRATMPKKQRLEKQQPAPRRERTYSFSPGRNDSIRVAGQKGSVPLGPGRLTGLFPADRNDGEEKGDPAWQRAPTLHNARHGQPSRSSRRKTSKRRREETDREAEIKAMANFAPVRPAADPWTSGRPIRKQSKRLKTGLGFRRSFENPQSDVSLPISIHSSMSSDTELHSFRVSALEALSPRPTLRYAVYPRWGPGHGSAPSRTQQQKRKVSERVPESVVRAHKRVDSFADDLDAADLRELMERDNRRRERKRQRDQERIERRLARRSEKQREAVAEARHSGSPPPVNMERGVLGRELGLGIDAASAVVTSSRRRSWSSSRHSRNISTTKDSEPEQEQTQEQVPEQEPQPETMDMEPEPAAVHHFHRTTSIPPEAPPSPTLPAQPVPERKTSKKLTPKASVRLKRSFLRRISRSRSPNATESDQHAISQYSSRQDEGEAPRKDSRTRISFSALFRLGKRNRRNSGPSSFSNTSRETMQASAAAQVYSQSATHVPQPQEEAPVQVPMPAIPPPVNYIPRKVSNGVPKRTRSRFREDLPELPLSPPDSRVGSPEVEMPPLPVVSESKSGEISLHTTPAVRHDTPTSDLRRVDEKMEKMEKLEKMRQTPTSLRHSIQPSPEPVSLASIDSEGSWLSGRVGARRSSGMRGSMQRLPPHNISHSASPNDTEEELADDEYLSNLATPSREMLADEERTPRKSTGDAFPSSDEDEMMEDADMKWGSVDRQRTTVVQHQRVKSREGMLKSYTEDSTSPEGSEEGETPKLQRATSVSLSRGNARHVSAGSTKMLEVSPRSSVDNRRSTDAVF